MLSVAPGFIPDGFCLRKYHHPVLSPLGNVQDHDNLRNRDMSDITIRYARPEDIPRMCDLLTDLFSIESDFVADKKNQANGLNALLAEFPERALVLVAVHGGTVVGMATVQTLISTSEGGRVGFVEDVIVDRKFRGEGIGTLLLQEVIAWSRQSGIKRLQLLADITNQRALDFYSSREWTHTRLICLRKFI